MFVFVKRYKKRAAPKIVFVGVEQDSIYIFMKSMKILSKSDTLPSISQSGVDFQKKLELVSGKLGSQSSAKQKIFTFF